MVERWKMNQIGFVNFWLYDKESFQLEDGKLLLRGQNGSGKSITTQSFIPFILDGDRSPSRLDPFGTSSRTMDYYFLGDNEREDSTGYLYLEFKKENEYRTIAIGQHAHHGRPMTFWGFVINDGRRINVDLKLYRESGDKIIPLSRQEMKKELGDDIPFTTSQKEYKEMVNKYLFGFERIEQFEQYIKLLIKVRAPKLSNVFKPTKVYEILNDSLQVLSDEDLRPMVDAMEKMDSIQEHLDGLKRAYNDTSAIVKEYKHYNLYMLSKKSHNYLNALKESTLASKEYDQFLQMVDSWEKSLLDKKSALEKFQIEESYIRNQLQQLIDPELENLDLKLQNLTAEEKEYTNSKNQKKIQIEQKNEMIHECEVELKKLNDLMDYTEKKLTDCIRDMDEYQLEIKNDFHLKLKEDIQMNKDIDFDLYNNQLITLQKNVRDGQNVLRRYNELQKKYEEDKEEENLVNKAHQDEQYHYEQLQTNKEKIQDELLTVILSLKKNAYWNVDENSILEANKIIEEYEGASDTLRLKSVFQKDYDRKVQSKKESIAILKANEKQIFSELNDKKDEYRKVESQKEIEPERDEYAVSSRNQLKQVGVEAYPFYQTVTFSSGLNEAEQAILEQQLYKSGVLDALVVSDKDYQRIQNEFPNLLDCLIYVKQDGYQTFDGLLLEQNLPSEIQKSVTRILSNITNENGSLILKKDGYFKHGLIEGYVYKKESEYVGVNARRRKKQQLLNQLQLDIDHIETDLQAKRNEINEVNSYIEHMQEDYQKIPDTTELNDICNDMYQSDLRLQEYARKKKEVEETTRKSYQIFKEAEKRMLSVCKLLPYTRSTEEYEDILQSIDSYKDLLYSLRQFVTEKENFISSKNVQEQLMNQYYEEIDSLSLEKDKYDAKIQYCTKQINQIKEIMNSPETQEKAKKITELRQKEKENQINTQNIMQDLAIVQHDLENADEQIVGKKSNAQEKEEYLKCVQQYLEEELSLNLVLKNDNQSLESCANEAIELEESNFMVKSSAEMVARLHESYQKNTSNLADYNVSINHVFEDEQQAVSDRDRSIVNAYFGGKKLDLYEFLEQLKNSIDMQDELIKKKDREIFEDILTQTISKKLTERIEDSRTWVKQMSSLMKNMDTSMGLSFSLEWKPNNPEDIDELDARELEKILMRDSALITSEDITRVSKHFRSIIQREKQQIEMNNAIVNYMDLVRNALDYRKWYSFKMSYIRRNEGKKDLTNAAFNRFSGGEKAMAMYVPLFAAVNAQYEKCTHDDHPRMIALDEAFAGVDEKNISSMFEMVEAMDFDYIMNSQALWGCYATVKRLKISELLRPLNENFVTVVNYIWNGKEKILQ